MRVKDLKVGDKIVVDGVEGFYGIYADPYHSWLAGSVATVVGEENDNITFDGVRKLAVEGTQGYFRLSSFSDNTFNLVEEEVKKEEVGDETLLENSGCHTYIHDMIERNFLTPVKVTVVGGVVSSIYLIDGIPFQHGIAGGVESWGKMEEGDVNLDSPENDGKTWVKTVGRCGGYGNISEGTLGWVDYNASRGYAGLDVHFPSLGYTLYFTAEEVETELIFI